MAMPKKKKPISSNVKKGFETLEALEPKAAKEKIPGKKSASPNQNKGGRPSPIADRTGRFSLYLSQTTMDRFTMAFPQEQIKQRALGEKVDKSMVIETAILEWMERKGY